MAEAGALLAGLLVYGLLPLWRQWRWKVIDVLCGLSRHGVVVVHHITPLRQLPVGPGESASGCQFGLMRPGVRLDARAGGLTVSTS